MAPAAPPPAKAKKALAKLADYNQLNEKFTTPTSSKQKSQKPKLLINEIDNNKNDNSGGGGGSPASSLGNLSFSSTKDKSLFWTFFIILFIYSN